MWGRLDLQELELRHLDFLEIATKHRKKVNVYKGEKYLLNEVT